MSLLIKFLNNGEIGEAVNSPGCEPGMHRFDPGISPQSRNNEPMHAQRFFFIILLVDFKLNQQYVEKNECVF